MKNIVETRDLTKIYNKNFRAVDDISVETQERRAI